MFERTRTAAEETWEDKIRHIGREIIDGVSLRGMATENLMDPYPSPAEERITKKLPAHNIGYGIPTTETIP